jgi:hypothetical protein
VQATSCILYNRVDDEVVKASARDFLNRYKEGDLPLLNQVECTILRVARKILIISTYPKLRERLEQELKLAPEMTRFVLPPTALDLSYGDEAAFHGLWFEKIKLLQRTRLEQLLDAFLRIEASIEVDFSAARSRLRGGERQIGGFEYYGLNGKHYAFKNIMKNLKIA